jgi:hypothetical protein
VLPVGLTQVGLTSGLDTGPLGICSSFIVLSFSFSFALSEGVWVPPVFSLGVDFGLAGLDRLAGSILDGFQEGVGLLG